MNTKKPPEKAIFPMTGMPVCFGDPIAWLSEHREEHINIQANIEKLKVLMP